METDDWKSIKRVVGNAGPPIRTELPDTFVQSALRRWNPSSNEPSYS